MNAVNGGEGSSTSESQPQKTKADIKNIIPLDLYEGMEYASIISTRLIFTPIQNGKLSIPPHDVKRFYRAFFKTFWFTRLIISERLRKSIELWNEEFARDWRNAATLERGVNLFINFYDELATTGFITYFEGTVQPGFLNYELMTSDEEIEVERRVALLNKRKGRG